MSVLATYDESGDRLATPVTDGAEIAAQLEKLGVQFERWEADRPLGAEASQKDVLAAYADSVEKLNRRYGFQSVDVVSLGPDDPKAGEMRQKFLAEHTHSDFEIRFFVEGRGLFYLHVDGRVHLLLCEQGDLISVPAGTTHWFDMGVRPDFRCIRFFTTADGWLGDFTGSGISARFPDFDAFLAET